jgi:hypothetical protein
VPNKEHNNKSKITLKIKYKNIYEEGHTQESIYHFYPYLALKTGGGTLCTKKMTKPGYMPKSATRQGTYFDGP